VELGIPGKKLAVLLSEEQIQARVAELGAQITRDYAGQEIVLLIVLKGSMIFAADLCRHIGVPVSLEVMGLSSYGDSTDTSGEVQVTLDFTKPVKQKHILVCEDIVDTGLTMRYLLRTLSARDPASIKVVSLLEKPTRKRVEVALDYIGFVIPDHFVIGYGLDLEQRFRNLRFIGHVVDA
jgi:hypoxanthine phosphoribosyltransferase